MEFLAKELIIWAQPLFLLSLFVIGQHKMSKKRGCYCQCHLNLSNDWGLQNVYCIFTTLQRCWTSKVTALPRAVSSQSKSVNDYHQQMNYLNVFPSSRAQG